MINEVIMVLSSLSLALALYTQSIWPMRPRDLRKLTFLIKRRIQAFPDWVQRESRVPMWDRLPGQLKKDLNPHRATITKTPSWAACRAGWKPRADLEHSFPATLHFTWGWSQFHFRAPVLHSVRSAYDWPASWLSAKFPCWKNWNSSWSIYSRHEIRVTIQGN